MSLLLEMVWWGIGYGVARLILPLVSFGKVQVLPLESRGEGSGWFGYRRNGSGQLEIEPTPACGIGLVICCIGLTIVLHLIR
jgi:hypothetical protein